MRLTALVCMVTFQATVALAQPVSIPNVAVLYQQLEEAVAQQDWIRAQEITTQLLVLQPERSAELTAYQQRLQRLAGFLPPLPEPSPDPVPLAERLQVHSVTAAVKTTRQEFLTTYPVTHRGCASILRTPVTLPDTYEVVVRVMGPVGLPTQRIPVQIAVNDGAIEITPEMFFGSQALASYRFQFRGSQVPNPRTVRVTLPTGAARSFALDLPAATTILKRDPVQLIPVRLFRDPCLGPLEERL